MKKHNKQYKGKPKGDRRVCTVKGWGQIKPHFCNCSVDQRCQEPLYKFRGLDEQE